MIRESSINNLLINLFVFKNYNNIKLTIHKIPITMTRNNFFVKLQDVNISITGFQYGKWKLIKQVKVEDIIKSRRIYSSVY